MDLHFIVQLMHTTLKNVELLKHFKIRKAAPTCFGLQGNYHQGATASTLLKLHTCFSVDTYSSYKTLSVSYYAAMTLTSCTSCMYPHWTKCVILAKYWLWLPDDSFLVNRNMSEQLSLF